MYVDSSNRECEVNGINIKTTVTERFNVDYGIIIEIPEKSDYTIYGTILFEVLDSQVQAGFNLIEVGGVK